MPELTARAYVDEDGWLRFEEDLADADTDAWIAACADSTCDLEGWR